MPKTNMKTQYPWTNAPLNEKRWTYSYTIRPIDRTHHPGKWDYTYYSPGELSFSSIKKAHAFINGDCVKRIYNKGRHIRWFYYDDETNSYK